MGVSLHAATPLYQPSIDKPEDSTVNPAGSATVDTAVQRNGAKSVRLDAPKGRMPSVVRFPAVNLTSASATSSPAGSEPRTSTVRDLDRSPIATGAALSMASMPFDVHSDFARRHRPWTRLSLHFVASRSQDQIVLTVGNGGAFTGHGMVRRRHPG